MEMVICKSVPLYQNSSSLVCWTTLNICKSNIITIYLIVSYIQFEILQAKPTLWCLEHYNI